MKVLGKEIVIQIGKTRQNKKIALYFKIYMKKCFKKSTEGKKSHHHHHLSFSL